MGDDRSMRWDAATQRLAEIWESVSTGQMDARELPLAQLVDETRSALSQPPSDFGDQERWLGRAADALRLLSQLAAAKARRLAPPPAGVAAGDDSGVESGEAAALAQHAAALDDETSDEGVPGAEMVQLRAAAYERFRRVACALEEQAARWSQVQPRPAPSGLLETLRLLGPWSDDGPGVRPESLVEALSRVMRRQQLGDKARGAPTKALDWEGLIGRLRNRIGDERVEMAQLLLEAEDRAEVIGRFLVVLELVRVGEMWLSEENGRIWIARRSS